MPRVKYGHYVYKKFECNKCDDSICQITLMRKIRKGCEKPSDFDGTKAIQNGICIHPSFVDAEWKIVAEGITKPTDSNIGNKGGK